MLTVITSDNKADHKKKQTTFCLRNQIRNDISCELSDGRRSICNIKVYFLPEILNVYIAICHGGVFSVTKPRGV